MNAAGWFAVNLAGVLCLTSTACSSAQRSQPQSDLSERLETMAAAKGRPLYFLGRSFDGIDLTSVEGGDFFYGTCEFEGEGGCAPPIQVQNGSTNMTGVVGCGRLADIRGVPTVSLGGGLVLFTVDSTVTIFDDGAGRDLRSMAEALRPVSGPADVTKPLPAPRRTSSTRSPRIAVHNRETSVRRSRIDVPPVRSEVHRALIGQMSAPCQREIRALVVRRRGP